MQQQDHSHRIEILAIGTLPGRAGEALTALFRVHQWPDDPAAQESLLAASGNAIRGVVNVLRPVTAALMARLPRLEIVGNFGVGYDVVDTVHAAARGIVVTNTPDVLTEEVADVAVALLTMTARELTAAERYLRDGSWARLGTRPYSAATLRDRTIGIVGLGRIGEAIARRLAAARLPVVYHSRREKPDAPYLYFSGLKAMAEAVDTLMIVLPGTPETEKLIDADILEALGPRGIVVNIGRGSVVDEEALIEALETRRIHAAGLDVFLDEPNIDPRFLALDNAVLLPHLASASMHTREAMGLLVVDNLTDWFAHRRLKTPVPETPIPPRRDPIET